MESIAELLWARAIDTIIGCTIGIGVLLVTAPRALAVPIPQELAAALDAAQELLKFAAAGDAVSPGAKRSRRNLQHRAIALLTAYELGAGARQQDRRFAEGLWPAVVTAQRVLYRLLEATDKGHVVRSPRRATVPLRNGICRGPAPSSYAICRRDRPVLQVSPGTVGHRGNRIAGGGEFQQLLSGMQSRGETCAGSERPTREAASTSSTPIRSRSRGLCRWREPKGAQQCFPPRIRGIPL